MTNFAQQGLTLNGNTVIQHNGLNIYLTKEGKPIRFEKAWFKIENPKRILAETAEYLLSQTKLKMLREGLYFVGHIQKTGDDSYRIIQWDWTYIMHDNIPLKKVHEVLFQYSYYLSEIEDNSYVQIAHKIPFDKNGIVLKNDDHRFFEDCSNK